VGVGANDTRFQTISHLGMLLHVGDTAMGYDLSTAVFNDADMKPLEEAAGGASAKVVLPDVILVRKQFCRRFEKRKKHHLNRNWTLKNMEGVQESPAMMKKADRSKQEMDYQYFLDDLENDKEMRSKINIYRRRRIDMMSTNPQDDHSMMQQHRRGDDDDDDDDDDDGHGGVIPVEELLDDMHVDDQVHTTTTYILASENAENGFNVQNGSHTCPNL
jgi:nonsense-mediated mRNA decay protein 3